MPKTAGHDGIGTKLAQHPKVHEDRNISQKIMRTSFLGFIVLKRPCWRCHSINRRIRTMIVIGVIKGESDRNTGNLKSSGRSAATGFSVKK